MSEFRIIELPAFKDPRGHLTVMQRALPFDIQRVFWITGADGHTRGGHRHHTTRQALVALAGSVVVLMDDGTRRRDVVLDAPNHCLIVEPDDWHTMTFSPGAVLLVLASQLYDVKEYIDQPY
jgi:dTDP-4-dehydrorhamnose 3,5-epimerase-like enzyme